MTGNRPSTGRIFSKNASGNIIPKVNTFNYYENSPSTLEIEAFIEQNGFVKIRDNGVVRNQVVDSTYKNCKYNDVELDYFVL